MNDQPKYQDASLSPAERTEDLLQRMTLEEIVGQMVQLPLQHGDTDQWVLERHIGSFLHTPLVDVVRLQKLAETTRLGIPILFGEDAIHGHCFQPGATIFPTQLALSCSWNPDQFEAMARVTAVEMAATGMYWTFSPVLCMGRDWRWGRIDETCGEDPLLVGDLAGAMVAGYQGESLSAPTSVLACAKHYAGYATSTGGRDAYESPVSRRGLKAEFLPPFRQVAQAGCATFMAGYQANDGVPCSADRWLLREVLCDEWGFEGFVVTDWNNVGALVTGQSVCATARDAARVAIEAGNHMIMTTPDFYDHALDLVRAGEVDASLIRDACRRILTMKFALGIFDEKRHPATDRIERDVGCDAHIAKALDAARDSLVLLENRDELLPLGDGVTRVALVGPNADDVRGQFGDWSFGSQQANLETNGHKEEACITPRKALDARAGITLCYARGCDAVDPQDKDIEEAVHAAQSSDVVIACVGDHASIHGESNDRSDLGLTGAQQELLEGVKATGKPLVVVLLCSKPLVVPWIQEHADAVICAFNPGMQGGTAVVEALWGEVNPHGKLSISFARAVGQMPINYQQMPGWHTCGNETGGYCDLTPEPLWPFGYGLSYTRYRYENLVCEQAVLSRDAVLKVSVDVTNQGVHDGVEIVQLYVNDLVSTVTTPVKSLKAYRRVPLAAGESARVELDLPVSSLALVLPDLSEVVEPGVFEIMVGPSSRDEELLRSTIEVV